MRTLVRSSLTNRRVKYVRAYLSPSAKGESGADEESARRS